MEFIYICGLSGSGKGVLRVLLDASHTKIITCPFQGFGYELLSKDFTNFINRNKSIDIIQRQEKMSKGYVLIQDKQLTIGEFIKIIAPSLQNLIDASFTNLIRAASVQDKEQFVNFNFNYDSFISRVQQAFLTKKIFNSALEIYEYLIHNFILEWKGIKSKTDDVIFLTSMHNGPEVLQNINSAFKDKKNYKIIGILRDYEGYILTNYLRYSKKEKRDEIFFKVKFIFSKKISSKYKKFIETLELISPKNFKVIFFNDLIENTKKSMEELSYWLKIEYNSKMLEPTLDSIVLEDNFTIKVHDKPNLYFNSFTRFILKLYSLFYAK